MEGCYEMGSALNLFDINFYRAFSGKVRLPMFRQLFDHSSIVAPMNLFMYLFSGVPYTAYFSVSNFRAWNCWKRIGN